MLHTLYPNCTTIAEGNLQYIYIFSSIENIILIMILFLFI